MKFLTVVLLAILLAGQSYAYGKRVVRLCEPVSSKELNFSGNGQYGVAGSSLEKPIRIQVIMNDSLPLKDFPVYFEVVAKPHKSEGFKVHKRKTLTDHNGIATTYVTLGSKPGDYEIAASTRGVSSNFIIYQLHARRTNWVFMLIIGLIGGLGLFLFGMHLMSDGMQKTAGDRMRTILSRLTHNRIVALGVGAFVTMIIQSSSVTTVMLVGFVQSKLMKFSRTIAVMLGAAIGTTITAQLIAFKLTDYSLMFIGLGAIILFFTSKERLKHTGETILGFGILFYGMYVMSEAMYPLRSYDPFVELLIKLENPILGIIVGAIFTALIQSSSASIGIFIIMATQGLLSLESSIPLILGANIGTSITAILASLKTGRESKKVAYSHTLIKIIGLMTVIWWIPTFSEIVVRFSPISHESPDSIKAMADEVPRQIANAHTLFNIILAVSVLPITNLIAKLMDRLMPSKDEETIVLSTKYLDKNLLQTPALALNVAKVEALRMSSIVREMMSDIIKALINKDRKALQNIAEHEVTVDYIREEIKNYVITITRENIGEERVHEAFQILYTIKEFEQIGDIIATNLYSVADKWISGDAEFSEDGKKELEAYHLKVLKQISRAMEVFSVVNLEKAQNIKEKHKRNADFARELEWSHYERLQSDVGKSVASSKAHIEILNLFKTISSHCSNIGRILLEWNGKQRPGKKGPVSF